MELCCNDSGELGMAIWERQCYFGCVDLMLASSVAGANIMCRLDAICCQVAAYSVQKVLHSTTCLPAEQKDAHHRGTQAVRDYRKDIFPFPTHPISVKSSIVAYIYPAKVNCMYLQPSIDLTYAMSYDVDLIWRPFVACECICGVNNGWHWPPTASMFIM